ncbi:type II toxin-antitoxin system VapB family antitoxin [Rothia nasimurium]|uniref:type II toxin-antitoxin system VapB family antitoxin n=1 Tax=Rothia nasimurium TaxID=85336 RepID=UPI001F30870A|nr:type II toxin-antitoxin system VapB family antitoxin [Rothia nasimurium]
MTQSTVFMNNRTQAVRLPAHMRFSENIKKVNVRKVGSERIIAPENAVWDSFFAPDAPAVTDDFMLSRDAGTQPEREEL